MFKRLFQVCVLLLAITVAGCDENFVEVNTNPNQPESVEPSLLLPGVLRDAATRHVFDGFLKGNILSQHAAKTLRVEFDIYDVGPSPLTWSTFYEVLRDVRNIERIARENGDENYEGVAIVLDAWLFSVLTDAYGDIPYEEALEAKGGINFPGYDSQENIYTGPNGLLARLERANTLLTSGSIDGDILFGGDVMMWKRFANSLRLRLLMRIVDRVDTSASMRAIVEDPATYPIFDSPDQNAALTFLQSGPNVWPLTPLKVGDFDAVMVSETLVEELSARNDPRLAEYARPTDPTIGTSDPSYVGLPNGLAEDNTPSFNLSRLGFQYYDYPGHPTVEPKPQALIMSHAEVMFILAEAAQRGFIGGDAEPFYREGIRSSMSYYDVSFAADSPVQSFEDYYEQPVVAYDGTLERIAEQKWIALFFHGLEPWFDFRRMDLPAFIEPGPDVIGPYPTRFAYPGEEESLNPENYQSAIQQMGGNRTDAPVWWDVD